MKIRLFLFILPLFFGFATHAQESILREVDNSVLQKYIELAKQNYPKKKVVEARELTAKTTLTESQLSYLDLFNANYYWSPRRDSSRVGGVAANDQLMQRGFMLGFSVNLGSILTRPSRVKVARANYEAAKAESLEYNTTLETEVKTRYYDYLLARKQLELNNLSLQNSKTIFADTRLKFERGELTVEQYTIAKTASDQAEAALLASEVVFLKSRNALEDLIGTKLENVN